MAGAVQGQGGPEEGWETLTEKGRFFTDEACRQFHHADYVPFPKETYNQGRLFTYNDTAVDINKTSALLNSREMRRRAIPDDIAKADAQIQDYQSAYVRFASYLEGEGKPLIAQEAQGIDGEYFTWARNKIKVIQADFREDVATSMRQGQHIIVNARINGTVTARLMVDTGASMTLLYQNVMDSLKLDPKAALGTATTIVADGRKVKANVIQLDSIEVGRSKVERTRAAVIPVSSADIDGLLGMSFLGHFSVSMDPVNGKLTLLSLK